MSFVRLVSVFGISLPLAMLGACGDDGGSSGDDVKTPDAPPTTDVGFNKPTAPLKANTESGGVFSDAGPADLSCLNSASTDMPTTIAVTLNTQLVDFQSGDLAKPADHPTVTAFKGIDVGNPFDTQTPDADAKLSIHIPAGTTRFGFKMTGDAILPTLLLNQYVDPSIATQTEPAKIQSVSTTTAMLLPALVGVMRTQGTGVLAGAVRDCQHREISNFIATVSSTKGTVTPLTGADAYYFSPSAGVPVRHGMQESSSADGLFMVIQLPVTAKAYVQVWGYPTEADVTADHLTLIAELEAPVVGDTVITGSYEPLRAGQ